MNLELKYVCTYVRTYVAKIKKNVYVQYRYLPTRSYRSYVLLPRFARESETSLETFERLNKVHLVLSFVVGAYATV